MSSQAAFPMVHHQPLHTCREAYPKPPSALGQLASSAVPQDNAVAQPQPIWPHGTQPQGPGYTLHVHDCVPTQHGWQYLKGANLGSVQANPVFMFFGHNKKEFSPGDIKELQTPSTPSEVPHQAISRCQECCISSLTTERQEEMQQLWTSVVCLARGDGRWDMAPNLQPPHCTDNQTIRLRLSSLGNTLRLWDSCAEVCWKCSWDQPWRERKEAGLDRRSCWPVMLSTKVSWSPGQWLSLQGPSEFVLSWDKGARLLCSRGNVTGSQLPLPSWGKGTVLGSKALGKENGT